MRSGIVLPLTLTLPLVFLSGALTCLLATWVWTDAGNLQTAVRSIPSSSDKTARAHGKEGPPALSDAEQLHQKIKVLCLVVTHPINHLKKAQHVQATWARRCSRVLFITNAEPRPSDPDYVNKTCQVLGAARDEGLAQDEGSDLPQVREQFCEDKNETVKSDEWTVSTSNGAALDTTAFQEFRRWFHAFFRANSGGISGGDMPDVTTNKEWRSWFDVPFPALKVEDTSLLRDGLWNKTKNGFLHAHKFFLDDYDWFLKADDDTYVIMENLRNLLQHHQPQEEIYFGCHFMQDVQDAGYMSGGGGYVLSRAALKRFVEVLEREDDETFTTEVEDLAMGQVMRKGGVEAGDSYDTLGKARFFPLSAADMASPDHDVQPAWYWQLTGQLPGSGPDRCSSTTISFHYMTSGDMYTMEMMLYHVKVYGMAK